MSLSAELRELPVDMVEPNLSQPRRYFDEARLEALAGSVGERGILQPVLVRPLENGRYGLIVGERRWRAAQLAGLESIPALVSRYDDVPALEAALIENMAREDLNPVEEARACKILVDELGMTHGQLGQRVGRSRSAISHLMRLLDLPIEILELLERGELNETQGRALLMVKDPQVRRRLAGRAIEEEWSTRTLEAHARKSNPVPVPATGTEHHQEPARVSEHAQDVTAMNIAKLWGDALGAEVLVRGLPRGRLRVEIVFETPEGAFALGERIGAAVAARPD